MRHAVFVPPFGELSDVRELANLARLAEARGWDGFFLWDHVLRPPHEPQEIADTWVALTAIALATERIRIGPMVTPLARRRPQIVARQAVSLDRLSEGRLVMGLGLGVDTSGELSRFGELTDQRERGDLLDEGAELLVRLWSGEVVDHRGRYFRADGVRFLPRAVQEPRVPVWPASRGRARRPLRRAARYEGTFVIEVDTAELEEAVEVVRHERGSLDGFEVAVRDIDHPDPDATQRAGATWTMTSTDPDAALDDVRSWIDAGPAGHR
jgi:alkanesulfonate monooxygenase SsuD/methylene tetrahydromethanopterin reductase-like flavin-dependent oxidoreductase (luciferase family)